MSDHEDIQHLDPDQLLTGFSSGGFIRVILISFVLHIVVIGGTSAWWIYDTFIAPPPEESADGDDAAVAEGEDGEATDGDGDAAGTDGEASDGEEAGDGTADAEVDPEEAARQAARDQYNETADPVSGPGDDLDFNLNDL